MADELLVINKLFEEVDSNSLSITLDEKNSNATIGAWSLERIGRQEKRIHLLYDI